jgi:hypothetical protein
MIMQAQRLARVGGGSFVPGCGRFTPADLVCARYTVNQVDLGIARDRHGKYHPHRDLNFG